MTMENLAFLRVVKNKTALAATLKEQIDLTDIINQFGYNYNILSIVNDAAEPIALYINGSKAFELSGGIKDSITLSPEDNIIFSSIQIENLHATDALSIGDVVFTVGRGGVLVG